MTVLYRVDVAYVHVLYRMDVWFMRYGYKIKEVKYAIKYTC